MIFSCCFVGRFWNGAGGGSTFGVAGDVFWCLVGGLVAGS